jgi:hypothetical protein
LKIEEKLRLSEDRGQIPKIKDCPLKNQIGDQPTPALLHSEMTLKILFICLSKIDSDIM